MIRDEIMDWTTFVVLLCATLFIIVVILVMGLIYPDPRSEARGMERAEAERRGSEERAEREFLLWHEECADLRETAMRRYEERVKGGRR